VDSGESFRSFKNGTPLCFNGIELPFPLFHVFRWLRALRFDRVKGPFGGDDAVDSRTGRLNQFLRGVSMKPPAGTTVPIPKWTNYVVTDLGGRDPLGLSRVSFMITDYLVTGIITTTSRARYYSFYPWALWHIDNLERPKRYADFTAAFRRREAFLALCTLHHNPESAGVVGADAVRSRLSTYRESKEVDTNFAVLPSNSLGGFGQYYGGSLYALGLTHRDENGIDHAEAGRGVALAEAFNRSIARTKYYRQGYFAETEIPFDVLKKSASQFSLDCLSEELANEERTLLRSLLFAWDKAAISDTDLLRRHTLGLILDTISEYGKVGFKPSSDNVDHHLVYLPYYYGAVWRDSDSAQPYRPPALFAGYLSPNSVPKQHQVVVDELRGYFAFIQIQYWDSGRRIGYLSFALLQFHADLDKCNQFASLSLRETKEDLLLIVFPRKRSLYESH
jgi:hypothetical protein